MGGGLHKVKTPLASISNSVSVELQSQLLIPRTTGRSVCHTPMTALTKDEVIAQLQKEVRILLHLASKMDR